EPFSQRKRSLAPLLSVGLLGKHSVDRAIVIRPPKLLAGRKRLQYLRRRIDVLVGFASLRSIPVDARELAQGVAHLFLLVQRLPERQRLLTGRNGVCDAPGQYKLVRQSVEQFGVLL